MFVHLPAGSLLLCAEADCGRGGMGGWHLGRESILREASAESETSAAKRYPCALLGLMGKRITGPASSWWDTCRAPLGPAHSLTGQGLHLWFLLQWKPACDAVGPAHNVSRP